MTKAQTERDEKFFGSVNLWKEAYVITLGNVKAYKLRLLELSTWDKSGGNERERMAKITALQILIHNDK
jgi:hypothetical protein